MMVSAPHVQLVVIEGREEQVWREEGGGQGGVGGGGGRQRGHNCLRLALVQRLPGIDVRGDRQQTVALTPRRLHRFC
jgi:hypothetical protein